MAKAKIIGVSKFTYDVKDKETKQKTGEQNTLGKLFCTFKDTKDENATGLSCAEVIVNAKDLPNFKVNDDVILVKFGGKYQVVDDE